MIKEIETIEEFLNESLKIQEEASKQTLGKTIENPGTLINIGFQLGNTSNCPKMKP